MAKEWKDMSTDEKLEALRKDIAIAFSHINQSTARVDHIGNRIDEHLARLLHMNEETNTTLREVAEDVVSLKKKVEET